MHPFKKNGHVFIIRIWSETREIDDARPEWRGSVEHVPSGTQRYVRDLDGISTFIAAYLTDLGMKLSISWRLKLWFKRWQVERPKSKRSCQEENSEELS